METKHFYRTEKQASAAADIAAILALRNIPEIEK